MESFTNSVVLPESLPQTEQSLFNGLHRNFLKILFFRLGLFFVILIAVFVTLVLLNSEFPRAAIFIISVVITLLVAYSVVITILGFPRKGYLIREHDISYKKGIVVFKQITVPFNRIQHVEVNQGILEKMYKLSTVKIFTAGGNTSDLSIPGIPEETAQKIKAFLSEKISGHE